MGWLDLLDVVLQRHLAADAADEDGLQPRPVRVGVRRPPVAAPLALLPHGVPLVHLPHGVPGPPPLLRRPPAARSEAEP